MKVLLLIALIGLAAAVPPQWARNKDKDRKDASGSREDKSGEKKAEVPQVVKTPEVKTPEVKSVLDQFNDVCGRPANPPNAMFIVGGTEARRNSWPWMAQLTYFGSLRCGGSLVTNRHIVTAAHCVTSTQARNWKVVLGDHDRNQQESTQQEVSVSSVEYHSSYSSRTIDYDIAVMTLSTPVTFTDEISPVCLPGTQRFATGDPAYTTGWGTTSSGGSTATRLRQVYVPIIDTADCRRTDYSNSEITNRMICAGYEQGGKDACQGDSGGPLVTDKNNVWYLSGVVSWGYGCAAAGYPGVYAKTTELQSWIESKLT